MGVTSFGEDGQSSFCSRAFSLRSLVLIERLLITLCRQTDWFLRVRTHVKKYLYRPASRLNQWVTEVERFFMKIESIIFLPIFVVLNKFLCSRCSATKFLTRDYG